MIVKPRLIATLGSMEESVKQSEQGKNQRQYLGMLLNTLTRLKRYIHGRYGMLSIKRYRLTTIQLKQREV